MDWDGKLDEDEILAMISFGADRICRSSEMSDTDITQIINRSIQKENDFQTLLEKEWESSVTESENAAKEREVKTSGLSLKFGARHIVSTFNIESRPGISAQTLLGKSTSTLAVTYWNNEYLDQLLQSLKAPTATTSENVDGPAAIVIEDGKSILDHEDECFVCGDGGTLMCCLYCPHTYHLDCLPLDVEPGNFICPQVFYLFLSFCKQNTPNLFPNHSCSIDARPVSNQLLRQEECFSDA